MKIFKIQIPALCRNFSYVYLLNLYQWQNNFFRLRTSSSPKFRIYIGLPCLGWGQVSKTVLSNCVRRVWETLDRQKKIHPTNQLSNADQIDDYWFAPHLRKIVQYSKLPLDERPPHLAATTIQSWLGNIKQFFTFLMTRKIYIGIRYKKIFG